MILAWARPVLRAEGQDWTLWKGLVGTRQGVRAWTEEHGLAQGHGVKAGGGHSSEGQNW